MLFGTFVGKLMAVEGDKEKVRGVVRVPNGTDRDYSFEASGVPAEVLAEKETGKNVVITGYLRFPAEKGSLPYVEVVDARTAVQRVSGVGRLVADPELRYTPTGKGVARARVAINYGKDTADFVNLEVWNRENFAAAEVLAQYGKKGQLLWFVGVLKAPEKDPDGNFYPPAITLSDFRFLSGTSGSKRDISADDLELEEEPAEAKPQAGEAKNSKPATKPGWEALKKKK